MGDYTHWHVGMKVVALRDGNPKWLAYAREFIRKGKVYTITNFEASEDPDVAVWVIFADSPVDPDDGAVAEFDCRGFHPIQERKSNISIFTVMLHDQRSKVPA